MKPNVQWSSKKLFYPIKLLLSEIVCYLSRKQFDRKPTNAGYSSLLLSTLALVILYEVLHYTIKHSRLQSPWTVNILTCLFAFKTLAFCLSIKHVLTATWKCNLLPYRSYYILIRGWPCHGGNTLSSSCQNAFDHMANTNVSNANKRAETLKVHGCQPTAIIYTVRMLCLVNRHIWTAVFLSNSSTF